MLYQLYFYVPESHLAAVKDAIFQAGAGKLGNYQCCCWQTKGTGQFCPQKDSKPFIGAVGQLGQLTEYKVEVVCKAEDLQSIVKALKSAHPYEEPAYGIIKLEAKS